jgi:hypothetical protein
VVEEQVEEEMVATAQEAQAVVVLEAVEMVQLTSVEGVVEITAPQAQEAQVL